MSQMISGWIPDRPNKCQKIILDPSKNYLPLPSELPQVTPNTPRDHQKGQNVTKKGCQQVSKNVEKSKRWGPTNLGYGINIFKKYEIELW